MKNHYCFLENFNNYFNRKIMKYNDLEDYQDHSSNSFIPLNAEAAPAEFDFNPNDNVATEIIANDVPFEPDYVLILDDDMGIVSRWFVIEQTRNRLKQWVYSLKRDVVSDNLDRVLNSRFFCEKGTLLDNDPMIVNDEGVRVNQIKTEEILLKDVSKVGWIVGYFERSASVNSVSSQSRFAPNTYFTTSEIANLIGGNFTETDLTDMFTTAKPFAISNPTFLMTYDALASLTHSFRSIHEIQNNMTGIAGTNIYIDTGYNIIGRMWNTKEEIAQFANNYFSSHIAGLLSAIQSATQMTHPSEKYLNAAQLATLRGFNGQVVKIGSSYYTISIENGSYEERPSEIRMGNITYFDNLVQSIYDQSNNPETRTTWILYTNYQVQQIKINLSEIPLNAYTTKISGSHNNLIDAPYAMFIIPAGKIEYIDGVTDPYYPFNDVKYTLEKQEALDIAASIMTALGTKAYDYQLLPYCPELERFFKIWDDIPSEGLNWGYRLSITDALNNSLLTEGVDFEYIKDSSNNPAGVILFPQISNFSFSIEKKLTLKRSMKIDSQTDFYRLCSPNYAGVFQFDVPRNGGKVLGFDVDCSYKPYNPYIRVAPQFDWLYGTNFHDGRGLICGGDFSLPIISDPWVQYQINNKNFANVFSRDIQNLDFMQSQEAIYEKVGAFTGGITAVGGGAAVGAKVGGVYGAAAGAFIGGTAATAGGIADITLGASRRREQRSYAVDKYKLSLANVKALPESLTRNSSITISNKIFPFLEYYTCTDVEKDALERKITYEGMTVMRIGTVADFLDLSKEFNYVKGEFIHLDDLSEDSHMADTIYDELSKGVYYYA